MLVEVTPTAGLPVKQETGATFAVSLATVPSHAVTNAGTFQVQIDAGAVASLALLDDAINTIDAAVGTKAMLVCGESTSGNAVPISVDADGVVNVTLVGLPSVQITGQATVDTELPTAAALADNSANPTTPLIGSCLLVFDGNFWDRARGTSADGLLVNMGTNNDVTVTSGSITANAGTNLNTSALALESGGNLASIAVDTSRLAGKYVDFDTGAGTDSVVAVGLLLPASGGAVIGGTSSNPFRTDPTGTTTQPVSATSLPLPTNAAAETGGNLAAVATSLNVMDDWDETDRCKSNIIVGQAGITAGAGAVAANTPRVTLASDDPSVALLTTIDAGTGNAVTALQIIDDWDESDRAKVNLIAAQAGITGGAGAVAANTPRVTLASDDPAVTALQILDNIVSGSEAQVDVVAALPAGDNNIGNVDLASSIPAGTNNIGDVDVLTLPALPAGTNNIGDVDVLTIAAGTNLIGDVGIQPRAAGGCSIFRSIDLDETEEAIKASAGQLYGFIAINLATGVRYLKFYNLTTGDCTVGTSTPVMTIPVPTQAATANGAGLIFFLPQGIEFTAAITAAATTGIADADTGAPGANEMILNAFYE